MSPTRTYTVHTPHIIITPTVTPLPHPLAHYTSHTIPTTTVHTAIPTLPHIRPQQQPVTHCDTMRLQLPTSAHSHPPTAQQPSQQPHHLYLNDPLIDLTLQILHRSSSYQSSRHYVSPSFTNQLAHQDRDSTTHTRQFEQPLGPNKRTQGHTYILTPHNITDTHWIMLVRHMHQRTTQLLSHDPYTTLFDLTSIDTRLTLFDPNNLPATPLRPAPIVSQQTIIHQDTYNCGVAIILMAIIYLYHPPPNTFPWHTLHQPSLLDSLRPIILATITTNSPPDITFPNPPDNNSTQPGLQCTTDDSLDQAKQTSLHPAMNPNLNINLTSMHNATPPTHPQSRHSSSIPSAHINIPTLQTPNRPARAPHPRHYSIRKPIEPNITTSLLHPTGLHETRTTYPLHIAHTTQPSPTHGSTTPPAHDTSPHTHTHYTADPPSQQSSLQDTYTNTTPHQRATPIHLATPSNPTSSS